MIFIKNHLLILIINISNTFGKGLVFRKKSFSLERILNDNFPEKESFNFVQVGANDGISFDFLYDFVVRRISAGIVIEPVKEYFDELQSNYKEFENIVKVNKAVHPLKKSIFINKISSDVVKKYPDWVKGIASLDPNHHLKTGINSSDIVQEEVMADSLMNILNENLENKKIAYFQVDTEGFDFEVIKGLDFKIFRPLIIKYENVNLSIMDQNNLKRILKNQKYFLFDELGDTIAINLKKIKLF